MSSRASVPPGFRLWWIAPYRKTDDSEWPYLHFVGFRGRFRYKFFNLSLGWGTKKTNTWANRER